MNIKLGILLIATRRYTVFVERLYDQLKMFVRVPCDVVLFTDSPNTFCDITFPIPPYEFPLATLYRYKIFCEYEDILRTFSHLLYLDVDMGVIDYIGEEFIVDGLLAVRHPAFFAKGGWGSPNNPRQSKSWFPESERKNYYCGGVQGGRSDVYLNACFEMAAGIQEDEKRGIMAEWHDETFWNRYTNHVAPNLVSELGPAYCMVEQVPLRYSWGIADIKPKILALAKDHAEIRK